MGTSGSSKGTATESINTQMPETILLIEDEEDVADLIRYHLKKSKFRVLHASDGADGVRTALEERPDAVVLDIMMPRLNGFEVAKKLKADPRTEPIPILFLSAKGESDSRIKGLEIGAEDYITKPFSPRELVLRIQSVLKRTRASLISETISTGPIVLEQANRASIFWRKFGGTIVLSTRARWTPMSGASARSSASIQKCFRP